MINTIDKDLFDRWEQAISTINNDQDIIYLDKQIIKLFKLSTPVIIKNNNSIDYIYTQKINNTIDTIQKLREDKVKNILRIYNL